MAIETEAVGRYEATHASLYTKTWTPSIPIRANLVFVHGYSDHLGRYYGLFPTLATRGIQVFGFDQRGWGRSVNKSSDKGRTGPTSLVLADLLGFLEIHLASDVPVFVMGHSMGGGEVLTLACDPAHSALASRVRGWILESPFVDFASGTAPAAITVFFGRLLSRLLPNFQIKNVIPPAKLSRDPAVVVDIAADKLCHNTGTLAGISGLIERTEYLHSGNAKLTAPVRSLYLLHGSADMVTSFPASKKWFEAQTIEDGTFKTYEGAYHQLHSDLVKDEFYKDVGDWILARSQQPAVADTDAGQGPSSDSITKAVSENTRSNENEAGMTSAEDVRSDQPAAGATIDASVPPHSDIPTAKL